MCKECDMFGDLYGYSLTKAKHRVWILSDLQQRDPDKAKECLEVSMRDFDNMGRPADMVWYLGDAVEGDDLSHLEKMSSMQEEAFSKTGLPLYYVMGNHEFDYSLRCRRKGEMPVIPFYETVKRHDGWHTTASCEDWYFKAQIGDFAVYFLSDHIARDMSWVAHHGRIDGDGEKYGQKSRVGALRNDIEREIRPIITASHYSYAGGNRASDFQSQLFPLPNNLKIHFYGHAHIGDYTWAKEDAYRRISWVDWHDIPQIEVSSFEHIRGKCCRSVLLHIYEDNTFGIFFRDHDSAAFSECYFPAKKNYPPRENL